MTQLLSLCILSVVGTSMSLLLRPLSISTPEYPRGERESDLLLSRRSGKSGNKTLMFLPDEDDDKWEKRFKHLQNKWNKQPLTLNDENSYLQSVDSDVPDKYCINCKYFRKNEGGDDMGTCTAFPIKRYNIFDSSIENKEDSLLEFYCIIARYFECMCGTSGKRYIEK